jgi:hypothetical protein
MRANGLKHFAWNVDWKRPNDEVLTPAKKNERTRLEFGRHSTQLGNSHRI